MYSRVQLKGSDSKEGTGYCNIPLAKCLCTTVIEKEDKETESPFPLLGLLYCSRELLDATSQKRHMLGKGEYGEVYKGTLKGTTVAVKFLNEVHCYNSDATW